jgi:inositol-pentakisphosphate 2-kinase
MSTPSLSDGQLTPADTDPDLYFSSTEDDHIWPTAQDVVEMSIMLNGSALPLSWSRETLKRLPMGTRPVKMVGEGAANVVFELGIPEGNLRANDFKGLFCFHYCCQYMLIYVKDGFFVLPKPLQVANPPGSII